MEMTQYQRDFVRMLDSMRVDHKGESTCLGVGVKECEECLLANFCDNDICFNAEKIIEVVTQWAKEHPFITYKQKFEEVFGVSPSKTAMDDICPNRFLTDEFVCAERGGCETCKKDFWNSEYKPPKVDKEGVSE